VDWRDFLFAEPQGQTWVQFGELLLALLLSSLTSKHQGSARWLSNGALAPSASRNRRPLRCMKFAFATYTT
jgi:hypothetical protein